LYLVLDDQLPDGDPTMAVHTQAREFRDRDIIMDTDGRIFVVLGYIQPKDRILSFLKYMPDRQGKWSLGGQRYRRMFFGGVDSVVSGLEVVPQDYLSHDLHFGTELLEVPYVRVASHYRPEERLDEIVREGPSDRLEDMALRLAEALHDTLGIPMQDIGVAGSILWKGHNPSFSDINMNVYGFRNSWTLKNEHDAVGSSRDVRLRKSDEWERGINRILERIPVLSRPDIDMLFQRRFAFYYDDQCIGVTPVLRADEAPIIHGSEKYRTVEPTPVKAAFSVHSVEYGLFNPGIIEGRSEPLDKIGGLSATRVMIYDGIFNGLFNQGDTLEISGTLQQVTADGRAPGESYQLMVGSKSGAGLEYVRLKSQLS
jgi:predicted nucleotidyltransferase